MTFSSHTEKYDLIVEEMLVYSAEGTAP